jgi:RNA-directed DNA polymerase
MKAMRQTVRSWHLQLKCDKELSDLSAMFGPVLRGWANYYGRFYATAMQPLWRQVNNYLVRWMQSKYKRFKRAVARAAKALGNLAQRYPRLFVHWEKGFLPSAR